MKANRPTTAPVADIQTQSAQTLPDLVNALIEACRLLPDKMELRVQFIVNNTVISGDNFGVGNVQVSGDHNSNLANIHGNG